jgi:tRNA threonylcarbamoyl adenosine modification protein (Sua5/YciO/YrdC/YwlC family)
VLACQLDDKPAVEKLRSIRGIDERHLLTLMCRDLSELAVYAQVDNRQFRFLKDWTPGAYTFVLNATREVPRRLWHPSRKTVGLRVPASPIVAALLEEHGGPVLSTSLVLPGDELPLSDPDEVATRLARRVELVIEGGTMGLEPTTVIDLTGERPDVIRVGCGPIDRMTG